MPKFSAYMKGSDGSQGPAGASIIDGILVNEDSLPQQAGHGKHAYLVGTTDPKNLWVWDEENSEWKDQGPIANRIGEVTATMNAIPWTTTAIPSVQTQFSTSNQIDSLNFDFTIPFLDNAYDVINNKVNRDGDTMTGDLIISQSSSLYIQQPGNAYTDSNFSIGRTSKTYIGNSHISSGYTRTGIIQENANGNKEYFRLPISYSTENDNTYDILTNKALVTVEQGGTGVSTATANYIFAAPAANNGSPSFRQLVANDIPNLNASKITAGTLNVNRIPDLDASKITDGVLDVNRVPDLNASKITDGTLNIDRIPNLDTSKITDGILPIERGGTNANTSTQALDNLGAVSKSGGTISGTVTFFQPGNSYTDSILCVGRGTKTYIGNLGNSKGYTITGITQENVNGNKEYFILPTSYSTENDNTHDILTSKNAVTVKQGGTGKTTHIANAVLTGNGTSAVNNVATASGAFYATTINGVALFGTLPIEQGGTGATTAANARTNLDVVSKSGDNVTGNYYVTGSVFLENDYASITTTVGITTAMDRIYAIRDKNNLNLGYFRGRQETNGDVSVDIRARRRNNNTNIDNYLQLSVSTDGTRYIHVPESKQWRNALGADNGVWGISLGGTGATTAANARVNLNAVSKSGDTITGTLQVKSSTIDSTTTKAPSSTEYFAGLGMYDKSNKYLGYLQAVRDKNGSNYLQISARRVVNSVNKEAALILRLDAAGNPTCSLPTITSGTWHGSTIDVAYGGTGVTTYDNLRTKLGFGAMINTEPEAVSVPTGGYATIGSVTVPKGTSLFTAVCYFPSNKNGKRQFFFTNSNSATNAGSIFTDTRTAIDGTSIILRLVFLITLTKETTYYFRAYQDSGSAINATLKCRQIQVDS